MYLDAAYIAKMYLNEDNSDLVRSVVRNAGPVVSSELSVAEVNCVFHRLWRDGQLTLDQCRESVSVFADHVRAGIWGFTPVTGSILRLTADLSFLPPGYFLRAGDAIHLLTAQQLGEREIWTGDKHMLAAAPYFDLTGRSV